MVSTWTGGLAGRTGVPEVKRACQCTTRVPRDVRVVTELMRPSPLRPRHHDLHNVRVERVSPFEHPVLVFEERGVPGLRLSCEYGLAEVIHAMLFGYLLYCKRCR